MIKTINKILKEGKDFPVKYPNKYFNQKMYFKDEIILEKIKGREEINKNGYNDCKSDVKNAMKQIIDNCPTTFIQAFNKLLEELKW